MTVASFSLSVSKTGPGAARSRAARSALTAARPAPQSFNNGTSVTLTATPDAGSTFNGWSGDGTGTTTRTVTMDAARSVTALFKANQTINFAVPSGKVLRRCRLHPGATASSGLSVSDSSSTTSVCMISSGRSTSPPQGSCSVTASQAGTGRERGGGCDERTFTVTAKNLTITGAAANNKQYDGNTSATVDFTGGVLGWCGAWRRGEHRQLWIQRDFQQQDVGTGKPVTVIGCDPLGRRTQATTRCRSRAV